MLHVVHTTAEVKEFVMGWKSIGHTVGLVPTMGYLHKGHTELIKKARSENDRVVVSIYVNPTQFNDKKDLKNYPRDLTHDKQFCEVIDVDLIFNPYDSEMYTEQSATSVYTVGLSDHLCGKTRPGHFQGVCTVVSKLFNIITPHRAYFGEKDAQQLAIIKRMTDDLHFPVEIVSCPTIRESDGLAMSSRNKYLSAKERNTASVIFRSLQMAYEMISSGENTVNVIEDFIKRMITKEPLIIVDYVQVVDSETLQPVVEIQKNVLIAVAVFFEKTRLIDNFTYKFVNKTTLDYGTQHAKM